MARGVGLLLLVAALSAGPACGMDCNFGESTNFLQKIYNTCPRPFDSRDKSYCCPDVNGDSFRCCDAEEFALVAGLGFVIPVVVVTTIIITSMVCCISCLCCSCCPWYRRRHAGTVYGRVQTPAVVHVIQTPANVPQPVYVQNPPYPEHSTGMPQPPPQYTEQPYTKQAPYNPHYVQ